MTNDDRYSIIIIESNRQKIIAMASFCLIFSVSIYFAIFNIYSDRSKSELSIFVVCLCAATFMTLLTILLIVRCAFPPKMKIGPDGVSYRSVLINKTWAWSRIDGAKTGIAGGGFSSNLMLMVFRENSENPGDIRCVMLGNGWTQRNEDIRKLIIDRKQHYGS